MSPSVLFCLMFFFFQISIVKNVFINTDISLHQCQKNITLLRKISFLVEQPFQSCNFNCCTKANFNQTTCQVTSQTFAGLCLGRLCYFGECEQYLSASSTSPISSIEIPWPLWIDRSYIAIRYSILIFVLLVNVFLMILTLSFVIRSIRHAQAIAARKLRRYSLF